MRRSPDLLPRNRVPERLRHLLGIETLTAEQITFLLDQAKPFQEIQRHPLKKLATLRGKTFNWKEGCEATSF